MKKMIAGLMAAALFIIPVTQTFAQANKGAALDTVKEKAELLASEIVSNYGVSGLQYAIMDEGAVALSDSAGVDDKATKSPITKDTMLGIGSVSKMYVTAAAMMLADAKQIDIDKPLTTYIKDFKMADERYKQITPRMLMNHSAGLYGSHYESSMLFGDNDTSNHDKLLLRLQSERLKSAPGEYSVYSNDGFQLLEQLVERVSGLSYTEFIAQRIAKPLNLSATKTPLDSFDRTRLAKTYFPTMNQAMPVENANVIGTGGIYSTAEELSKFADVLIGNYPDILSAQSAEAMQSHEYKKGIWVSDESNTFNYGLGWDAVSLAPFDDYGITALSKGGDTMMYHAALIALPEHHISIAVLSSGGSSLYNSVFATNVLLEYLKAEDIIPDIQQGKTFEPSVKVDMPADLLAYSGFYGTVGSTLDIAIEDGELALPALMGGIIPEQKYVYTGNGQFKNKEGSITLSFDEQSNGKTYLKLSSYLDFPGIGQTLMVVYSYQKLDPNPLTPATKQAWETRNGKSYYPLNEKITSIFYLLQPYFVKKIAVNTEYGYASGTKIVDENTAVNAVEIPVTDGRDAFDLNFYSVKNKEYLMIDGSSFIREDAIAPLFSGKLSVSTIPPSGHAVWYKIDKKSANKKMTVDVPAGSGFAVYDAAGMIVNFSIASLEKSVTLPKDGLIVFGGKAGDSFKIDLKKQ
ncbi:serine hydrolase domain-containing protein [Paenibacillus sp. Leaf72]|uniref:serine hydrolase domain-containing protein n=1 Tax=Paenibacillus sp. Leaf72 TaxID=1736234 RepID=UPI0006FEDD92|nr:serine hydrolase domain-containing protein [Paenibacillus sp. Leaf72]KQO14727.1 serine hydrolase [Paenibacillus sp. Leaf72]